MSALSSNELAAGFEVGVWLWARVIPLFMLTPYLALGTTSASFSVVFSLAFACVATPLFMRAGVAPWTGSFGWTIASELVRGVCVACGCGLPLLALRMGGAVADTLSGWSLDAAAGSGRLARVSGWAGMVTAAGAGGVLGALRLLFEPGVLPPLGTPLVDVGRLRELLWSLSELLFRAIALGITLSAPLLLGVFVVAIVLGVCVRVYPTAALRALGASLLPWFCFALFCLALARWLNFVPEMMRGFAQSATRLLTGLP
jgi:flagellar biosynthesis protein FliR